MMRRPGCLNPNVAKAGGETIGRLHGNQGIGIISDYDDQPLIISSHLGTFAIATVCKINNIEELAATAFMKKMHFSEMSSGMTNPTELVAMLICQEDSFEAGITNAQEAIKGSCSMLLLTEDGLYAARDKLGRTPIVIGRKEGAHAASSETCAFPNLGYEIDRYLGPGEIVFLTAEGCEQRKKPQEYATSASTKNQAMIEKIRQRLNSL